MNFKFLNKVLTIALAIIAISFVACSSSDDDNATTEADTTVETVIDVDSSLFLTNTSAVTITVVPCTLSDGTDTDCYQIIATSTPTDHEMGPWCPENISDDASAGGIWLENGQVYDVDGAFIENMATFYNDSTWLMYDGNGDIYTTETEDDCANAANPNVGTEYENFCVECLPSYVADLTQTYLIPITPVKQTTPISFGGAGGPPGQSTGPSQRGLAFNGVVFDAPAPTDAILGAYTLAPFDDAGGHINLNAGYHYHAATGVSTQITQDDDHAAMIGYAIDGHGLYAQLDANGDEPTDLDDCRGHSDDTRGYHYHVDAPGNNNFIDCIYGAYVN
ncbi:YHYH protein [uncultured Lacinutrix sp.]|uniref:YHYH protein n=1 Tax=uncultured Lacinutrix sp. TaxID=574032 RepID=UPI00260DF126|nr:YHYH protein [uncultured Lacinutrix sp.]